MKNDPTKEKPFRLSWLFILLPLCLHLALARADSGVPTQIGADMVIESGSVALPDGFRQKAWVDVYSGIYPMPKLTARLRDSLGSRGYTFAENEQAAAASIMLGGHIRLYNDKRNYNKKLFFGELLESELHVTDAHRRHKRDRSALDYDAGVAQQGGRLLSQAGLPGGLLAGAALAILTDWLVDKSGVRDAIADSMDKATPAPQPRKADLKRSIWFCDADCKRTTHEAEVTLSVWRDKERLSSYMVRIERVMSDVDESAIAPLIMAALGRAIESMMAAAK